MINKIKIIFNLENNLPQINDEKSRHVYLDHYLSTLKTHSDHELNSESETSKGAFILGPDGVMLQVGHSLNNKETIGEKKSQKRPVYRLPNEVPAYLFFSNKLSNNVNLDYGNSLDRPFGTENALIKILRMV